MTLLNIINTLNPLCKVPKISRSISTLYSRMSQMQNGQLDGTTTGKSFLDLNWPSTKGIKALSNRICAYFSGLEFCSFLSRTWSNEDPSSFVNMESWAYFSSLTMSVFSMKINLKICCSLIDIKFTLKM